MAAATALPGHPRKDSPIAGRRTLVPIRTAASAAPPCRPGGRCWPATWSVRAFRHSGSGGCGCRRRIQPEHPHRLGQPGGLLLQTFGGGGAQISLKFEERGSFPVTSTSRTLKLDKLKPGNYTLEVQVEDAQGRSDRRAQEFQVVEGEEEKEG